jgi:hypothetical protein
MAVSRGGGFSGGGGGSFSSRGGSGSSTPGFSRKPFVGATTYFYISRSGQRHEFYASKPPKRESKLKTVALFLLCYLIAAMFFSLAFYSCIPRKLSQTACTPSGVYLDDRANIVENADAFNLQMKVFYEKTGIEPCLLTLNEEDFYKAIYGELYGESLITFANDEYYKKYSDEGHYLLTVIKLSDGEYIWCEMAGDDTVSLIDEEAFAEMQVNMIALKRGSDVGSVVGACIETLAVDVLTLTRSDKVGIAMMCIAAVAVLTVITVSLVNSLKRVKMVNEYCDFKEGFKERANGSEFKNF